MGKSMVSCFSTHRVVVVVAVVAVAVVVVVVVVVEHTYRQYVKHIQNSLKLTLWRYSIGQLTETRDNNDIMSTLFYE